MKVAIITDQHFGARKGSKIFHEYFLEFYNEVFFPTLEKLNIKTVIDMGDTFDNRRSIDFWSLEWAKENYYNRLKELGVTVHTIVGNHTAYYKNTNSINAIELLLNEYDNVVCYAKPTEVTFDKLKVLFLPWINSENEKSTFDLIKKTTSTVAMGHLELAGFAANRQCIMEHGFDRKLFEKFQSVFSGHYHTRSTDGQIFYLGNPYEIYWNDVNDTRGFHVFDTDSLDLKNIDNPFKMFHHVYYEDTPRQLFNFSQYKNKIVKVIVRKKSNDKEFEKFIDQLLSVEVHDLKIVENFELIENENFDIEESENTINILSKYVDEAEISLEKSDIKNIIQQIYNEACEVI